ncbi:MAG: glycoside hydrolase [Thalassobius sp.]|nr:glycoside hydrolase [Thalassovita sp.]
MKNLQALYFLFLFTMLVLPHKGISVQLNSTDKNDWQAKWISCASNLDTINSWTNYRKVFENKSNVKSATAYIAVDSKYWLWINGELVVFEGGLKRGPKPNATYYDEVDLTPYLKDGQNSIAVLVWYFGKDGFSHTSSGKSGLLFEMKINDKTALISDKTWKCTKNPAYWHSVEDTQPNYRLSESNILYDARNEIKDWEKKTFNANSWENAIELGEAGGAPWNALVKRPIPLWKDYGLKTFNKEYPFTSTGDTIKCKLHYNAHFTPYLSVTANAGEAIHILTDNYYGGTVPNVRAEYITRKGKQNYESLGWMNGHEFWFVIPEGVEVNSLGYRETGYNTEFTGSFECDDAFYNRLWEKSQRTLYITMRDTYMDCPDRERAQWWGDVVNELGESFYALDTQSHLLTKKGIYELMNWQKADGTIASPIPGNYDSELPMQMLNSVGYYGFWTYYFYTGDKKTIQDVYPAVKKYLSVWQLGEDGLVVPRKGGWTWGDWGENKDMAVLYNEWYYLACKGYARMSDLLENKKEKLWAEKQMQSIVENFNKSFWNGKEYRSPNYKNQTDDRANALAVLCGFVDESNYEAIKEVLDKQRHASPYMEKYVLEALVKTGNMDLALSRMKDRFAKMIDSELTTLWEGWGIGREGFGGGTINHAWSGGGLTILSQYVCGLYPIEAGWKKFAVNPQLGTLNYAQTQTETVKGLISLKVDKTQNFKLDLKVPKESEAIVYLPENSTKVSVNNKAVKFEKVDGKSFITLNAGDYKIVAE